jgi:hypothetical protein
MLALAGCGSAGGAKPPTAVAGGPQMASTSCSTSVSSGGAAVSRSQSCVAVLSDGRRFGCAARVLQGPVNAATIEHSKACTRLSPIAIPAALQALGVRIAHARACLTKHGLSASGGLIVPPPADGPDATNGELNTTAATITYYTDAARAAALAPDIARNLRRFRRAGHYAELQRDGAQSIVWFASPGGEVRAAVLACAAG